MFGIIIAVVVGIVVGLVGGYFLLNMAMNSALRRM